MGAADYLELGSWNVVCYVCGRKYKSSQVKKHWQGYYVCDKDWEPRHPQDFVRNVGDRMTPEWSQPMPADQFVPIYTLQARSAVAGLAIAGLAIAGFNPSV